MKILYFAWLRERLNRSDQQVEPPGTVTTIAGLMDWLAASDEAIALAFADRSQILCARDEDIVPQETPLAGARTIAFFPPMTGG